jgi:hypothetical protein
MSVDIPRLAVLGALAVLLAPASGAERASSEAPLTNAASGPRYDASTRITGVVLEALESPNNSYLHIDTGAEEFWVATPRIEVSAGETISMPEGARMIDFYSTPLDRRFDSLVFVGAVEVVGGEEAP